MICASTFALVLGLLNSAATCDVHKIRDTRVCTVAGIMAAGMDCGHTRTDETDSMNLDETLVFLEPQVGDPKKGTKDRAGAMCIAAEDFTRNKTDLETLCRMLVNRCTFEVREEIKAMGKRMTDLQTRTIRKAVRHKTKRNSIETPVPPQ